MLTGHVGLALNPTKNPYFTENPRIGPKIKPYYRMYEVKVKFAKNVTLAMT
jgi:hypothetical protein